MPDAPTAFAFTGDYALDATITSATVGSASYAGGDTIHVVLDFASYAASQGSGLAVLVVSGVQTGAFAITPQCPSPCTHDVTTEMLSANVTWSTSGPIVTPIDGTCMTADGSGCGFAD
jgi:hypothetical protein